MIFLNARKKAIQKIKDSWGKSTNTDFNFRLIESYFRNKDKSSSLQTISDRTINDLDFYELFMWVDHTNSKIGQQYLFDKLLTIEHNHSFAEQEEIIEFFNGNEEKRIDVQLYLSKLNNVEAYHISSLFQKEFIKAPKWHWVIKPLSASTIIVLVLTAFIPKVFLILLGLFLINLILHYKNKRIVDIYTDSIAQLKLMCDCVGVINKIDIPCGSNPSLISSLNSIRKLSADMSLFKAESYSGSFIVSILEYIKIAFLLEPIVLFRLFKKLDAKRSDIQILYEFIGKIDLALSVASVRAGVAYYCIPNISNDNTSLEFEDIYHPLISNFVANSMKLNGKSILLTGSNMSGKTTFIRTVALNTLFAQTINTCFAKVFKTPTVRIFSAIRISDDLLNDKSYYFEEVQAIKHLIEESQSTHRNLFLLDELFKGTNTIERIAAGKSVLSYLSKNKNIVFVSTHDIELTELLTDSYDLYHFTEVIENKQINFDYTLKTGNSATRNAIRILEINDFPTEITEEAKEIIDKMR